MCMSLSRRTASVTCLGHVLEPILTYVGKAPLPQDVPKWAMNRKVIGLELIWIEEQWMEKLNAPIATPGRLVM